MKLRFVFLLVCFLVLIFSQPSCRHEPFITPETPPAKESGFPEAIGRIMETRCATPGCHNQASHINAGGLLLDSWEHLLQGGSNGAVAIPFNPENSSLLYFINTNPALGNINIPTMPLNAPPLSEDEYTMIKSWVASGMPDADGNIPFSSNPDTRQKIYITMQGCDLVAVIDAESRVVMRYIAVGKTPAIENPHCIRVSPDGKYAYVGFLGGEYLQKIDTRTDSIVDELYLGVGSWNILCVSPDGKQLMVSDWLPKPQGKVILIDAESMQAIASFPSVMNYPHGIASNEDFTTFFITAQYGNVVYKLTPSTGDFKVLSIDGLPPVTTAGKRDPHEIMMTPDYSKYFLTCEASNEIRIMDARADTLIKAIPVGIKPQEIAISKSKPYALITCMEDNSANPGFRGSVYVIDYNTYETTRIDGPFFQPHGITVDDVNGTFYVASRNATQDGPAPHHTSSCAGRNGYYNVYDLNTFKRLPKRYEVTVEPYSADVRFK